MCVRDINSFSPPPMISRSMDFAELAVLEEHEIPLGSLNSGLTKFFVSVFPRLLGVFLFFLTEREIFFAGISVHVGSCNIT